jgi:hypothetical protein
MSQPLRIWSGTFARRSGPASRSNTDREADSERRAAATHPAAPPPTTTTSNTFLPAITGSLSLLKPPQPPGRTLQIVQCRLREPTVGMTLRLVGLTKQVRRARSRSRRGTSRATTIAIRTAPCVSAPLLADGILECEVGALDAAARAQDAEDLVEDGALSGTRVELRRSISRRRSSRRGTTAWSSLAVSASSAMLSAGLGPPR